MTRVLLALLAVAVAWGCTRELQLSALRAEVAQDASARSAIAAETQRLAALSNARITDELSTARRRIDAAARSTAERLRDASRRARTDSPASAVCVCDDATAIGVISDSTREALVELAADADAVSAQLMACQSYITSSLTAAESAPQ